jgi:archaemetzincin
MTRGTFLKSTFFAFVLLTGGIVLHLLENNLLDSLFKSSDFLITSSETAKTIIIQPYDGFPSSSIKEVEGKLKTIYSGNIVINNSVQLPIEAYYKKRNRYRADSLIRILGRNAKEDELIIGLTNKDISHTKGGEHPNPDYGIMGLGFCPGKSCVASTFRLKGVNRTEKLMKLAIHELGHTQGLHHCNVSSCLMRAAEGRDHFNELKAFCPKCKAKLEESGWVLL